MWVEPFAENFVKHMMWLWTSGFRFHAQLTRVSGGSTRPTSWRLQPSVCVDTLCELVVVSVANGPMTMNSGIW